MNITKGRESAVLGGLGHGKGSVHKIRNFYLYNDISLPGRANLNPPVFLLFGQNR